MKNLLKISMLCLVVFATGKANAQSTCSIDYSTTNSWGTGAQQKVVITNKGSAITTWELTWTFNGNEVITNSWDGIATQAGKVVSVKNASYNGSVIAGGTAAFGFLVNNPGPLAPTNFAVNGKPCGEQVATGTTTWLLDKAASSFYFVSVKNTNNGEPFTFTEFQGTVDNAGNAVLSIPLDSLSTNNDTRNTNVRNLLFESGLLPNLYFTTQLDLAVMDAIPAGETRLLSLTGNLTLHGVVKALAFDALVVKHDANSFSISPRKPILINSTDFEMNAGIEALRALVAIAAIGEKVPVYFKMFLTKDNPTAIAPILLVAAPGAPTSLLGTLTQSTSVAGLNWADNSTTESGFIIRRKGSDGRWVTAGSTLSNLASFNDTLTQDGAYSYKVFAYKDSVPSIVSNAVDLTRGVVVSSASTASTASTASVKSSTASTASTASTTSVKSSAASSTASTSSLSGQQLFTNLCSSCHTLTSAYPTQRNQALLSAYIRDYMPPSNPALCGTDCANSVATYLLSRFSSSSAASSAPAVACGTATATYGPRSLRVLTKNEYVSSILDLTGINVLVDLGKSTFDALPADNLVNSFSNNTVASIESGSLQSYNLVATKIVDLLASRSFSGVIDCPTTITSDACFTLLADGIGLKIFRRPLTTAERTAFQPFFTTTYTGGDIKEGIKIALRTMLTSPQFLYRSEVGVSINDIPAGATRPTVTLDSNAYVLSAYEMASFLSYTFAGTTPDATLLTAAKNEQLLTSAQIATQVDRLLTTTQAHTHFGNFAAQWMRTDRVLDIVKDTTLYPSFTADVRKAMAQEVRDVFNHVVLDQGEAFTTMYDGNYTFVNQALASFYGLSAVSGTNMRKVTGVSTRAGLVTSGAFMAVNAHDKETAPILRAVYARRVFMCHYVTPPPNGVALDGTDVDVLREEARVAWDAYLAANGGKATSRKKYEFLTSATLCSTCHAKMINPLGGGMEDFNAVGLPQVKDYNQLTIDSSGMLNGISSTDDGLTLSFNGAKELAHSIAGFDATRTCFIDNSFRLAMGTGAAYFDRDKAGINLSAAEKADYSCEVNKLDTVMKSSSNNTRSLLKALGSLDSVRYRKNVTR